MCIGAPVYLFIVAFARSCVGVFVLVYRCIRASACLCICLSVCLCIRALFAFRVLE